MRSNILDRHPSSSLRVYAVWFDMMPADGRGLIDRKVLNDRRVTNYYDPRRVVGTWYAQHSGGGEHVVWDAYFLYGRAARWTDEPGPLMSSGGPVVDSTGDLGSAFARVCC